MSEKTIVPIIRLSKEQSQFIECTANRIDDGGEVWYWFPFYFKKVD